MNTPSPKAVHTLEILKQSVEKALGSVDVLPELDLEW